MQGEKRNKWIQNKEYRRQYYLKNIDKCKKQNKQWRLDNREKLIEKYKRTYIKKIKENICPRCKMERNIHNTGTDRRRKNGLQTYCKKCCREYRIKTDYDKLYHFKNREKLNAKNRKYQSENKDKIRKYINNKHKTNWNFRISKNLRNRTYLAFIGFCKSQSIMDLIGCTIEELWVKLELQFKPGMTKENYGENGWDIDHKIPISFFNLSDPVEQKQCFHYWNLQPMWHKDNLIKGNSI